MIYIPTPYHPVENEAWSRPEREVIAEALQEAYQRGRCTPRESGAGTPGYMLSDALRKELVFTITNPDALLELAETIAQHFQDDTPCGKIFTDFLLALDGYITYERPDEESREG